MSLLPDIIGDSLQIAPAFTSSFITRGEQARQRFRKFLRPRYTLPLGWVQLTQSEAMQLWNHSISQQGDGITFDWFFWLSFHWLWVSIGVGDGVTTVWTIPGKETADHEFFKGSGTSISGVVAYGTGTQGEDKVTLSPAVAAGLPIYVNFTGRRRFTAAYGSEPAFPRRIEPDGYYTFATTLVTSK